MIDTEKALLWAHSNRGNSGKDAAGGAGDGATDIGGKSITRISRKDKSV